MSESTQYQNSRDATQTEEMYATTSFEKRKSTISFKHVGGMDDLKGIARMKIIIPFLKPELFKKYGKKAGGGILLYGPPGCGKTYFARAIAGEC